MRLCPAESGTAHSDARCLVADARTMEKADEAGSRFAAFKNRNREHTFDGAFGSGS